MFCTGNIPGYLECTDAAAADDDDDDEGKLIRGDRVSVDNTGSRVSCCQNSAEASAICVDKSKGTEID